MCGPPGRHISFAFDLAQSCCVIGVLSTQPAREPGSRAGNERGTSGTSGGHEATRAERAEHERDTRPPERNTSGTRAEHERGTSKALMGPNYATVQLAVVG